MSDSQVTASDAEIRVDLTFISGAICTVVMEESLWGFMFFSAGNRRVTELHAFTEIAVKATRMLVGGFDSVRGVPIPTISSR